MIKANFNTYNNFVTDSLYQWDINQDLIINGLNLSVAPEIHFTNANMDRAIVRQSTIDDGIITVRIPNSLLQEPLTIKAYVGLYEGETFKVVETIEIPIIAKARPYDYTFTDTDEEIYSFKALEREMDELKDRTYTKEEIITDETRSLYGLGADSVPDDMFKKVNEVMNEVTKIAGMAVLTYTGNGTYGPDNPCSITAPFKPKLLIMLNPNRLRTTIESRFKNLIYCDELTTEYTVDKGFSRDINLYSETWFDKSYAKKSADGLTISWYTEEVSNSGPGAQLNEDGVKYHVLAIG